MHLPLRLQCTERSKNCARCEVWELPPEIGERWSPEALNSCEDSNLPIGQSSHACVAPLPAPADSAISDLNEPLHLCDRNALTIGRTLSTNKSALRIDVDGDIQPALSQRSEFAPRLPLKELLGVDPCRRHVPILADRPKVLNRSTMLARPQLARPGGS